MLETKDDTIKVEQIGSSTNPVLEKDLTLKIAQDSEKIGMSYQYENNDIEAILAARLHQLVDENTTFR